jgi:hypothetical protein
VDLGHRQKETVKVNRIRIPEGSRRTWPTFVLALVLSLPPAANADPGAAATSVVRQVTTTVVDPAGRVLARQGQEENGSGTVIAYEGGLSLILTCRHVVPDGRHPLWVMVGDRYDTAEFVAAGKVDLALLTVADKLPVVRLAKAEAAAGEAVSQYGYPDRVRTPKVGKAVGYTGAVETETGARIFSLRISAAHGDSGAGVLDPRGNLTAVLWGGVERTLEAGSVGVGDIRSFILETKPKGFPKLVERLTADTKSVKVESGK